ncbi:unnamed protein product [Echinostoma caproni]|uniref:Protein PAT1 homolog 1 n=1 Tax=Echinostoma caproni TaxID=27848 RepID=A0A183B7A2_9TREM|nr:unnamed protein product [Echinostoma caproni]
MDAYEDIDELNDETFGAAEDGDWELEHEQFALAQGSTEHVAPDADQLPKFWEASEDVSFLWQPEALENYKNFFDDEGKERGVNVEETLQKLVSEDEAFEDPAILDISKKVSQPTLSGSALDKLLGAPAFPAAPANLFSSSRDIWSSSDTITSQRQPPSRPEQNSSSQNASLNLMELLHHIAQAKGALRGAGNEVHQKVPDISASHNLSSGTAELRPSAPSSVASTRISHPAGRDRVNFGGPLDTPSSLSLTDFKNVADSSRQNITHTNVGGVPWSQQTESSLPQITNNLLQKQFADPSQLPIGKSNCTANAVQAINNFGQNNTSDYVRASALRLLLMQAQDPRIVGRPPNTLPDLRYFQLLPPPNVPALMQTPTPLLGPQRLIGSGQVTQAATPLFPGSLNPNIAASFLLQQPPSRRVVPSNLLPMRSVSTVLPNSVAGQQHQTATRDGGLPVRVPISHTSLEVDEEFDPNHGSWMSDYESVGVLLMHLRPLVVSNPYVQVCLPRKT